MIRIGNCGRLALIAAALSCAATGVHPAAAQDHDTFTPMALDAGFGKMDLTPPSTPPEEIIKQFAAKEAEYRDALNHYTYRRTAKVETIDDDTNKPDGEWYEVDDVIFTPDGRRAERTVYAPESTLQRVIMTPSDMQDIQHGYQFVLTTADMPQYDVKYVGRQQVDEVKCYVFDVTPKQIEKHERYFLGRIWVDAKDLQIVVTDGRMVPDGTKHGSEDLHPPFMTWRQQIDGHYWFPVYTRGEGVLHFSGGHDYMAEDVHIRDIIKYSDYKQFGSTSKIIFDGQEAPAQTPQKPQPPK